MADNTKIWPIFRSANWWLSDDLFTWVKNSFYYSNNIEIREDAKSIYPKQTPRQWTEFDLWESVDYWVVKASIFFNNAWYVFCQYEVYKLNTNTDTVIPLWVYSWDTEEILDAEIFNWYVYFATTKHLYRISQTAADANWATKSNFTEISLKTSSNHPLYATDVLLAVGNWNEVSKVTKEIPDQIQDWIKLQTDYRVEFLNELWWFLRITATDWHYGNEILLWDKVNTVADEVIPMSWYRFLQSCIYNWYHYLLSDKWLWLVNWYQFYILKRIPTTSTGGMSDNWMIVFDDKLYFVTDKYIYIYWAKNKNYPDVLNVWSTTEWGWYPYAIATDGKDLIYSETGMVSWDYHTFVYLYKIWEFKWSNWEFQTMWYFWNSMSEIKQSMYMRVWYNIPDSWYIKIYYKTEASPNTWNDSDRTELTQSWWLTKSSDMRSPFATSIKLNCRFQWIQFKFVLNWIWTKLYSADLYYNDMLD
jgi:hypothetical protein